MPSIVPGYEYDVFISYRQKDNKGEKWVSQFVEDLQDELDSTFKVDISIYFDENPHDGLTDSHDVDLSLNNKIKCLVFVPIVSRTYCDTNSFAWKSEFQPFLEFCRNDEIGINVKLANGNTSKRVLPVRIHEIDEKDKNEFEKCIEGVIRPIDFIYRGKGINRPLRVNEPNPEENLNKTHYRDQINKVANSIKEVIDGIRYRDEISSRQVSLAKEKSSAEESVPQKRQILTRGILVMGAYLFGGWAFLQLLEMILQRFQYSPLWTDVFLYAILLFLPAIIALAFIPKQATNSTLGLWRKFLPPVNIAGLVIFLVFSFWGSDLGATTRSVTIQDEDGNSKTVQVLKDKYLKYMVSLPANVDSTFSSGWIGIAVIEGVMMNLLQVKPLRIASTRTDPTDLKGKLDLIEKTNSDYLLATNISQKNDSLIVTFEVIDVKGSVISKREFKEIEMLDLFDKVRDYLLNVLEIETEDILLPFEEIYTNKTDAWKAYANRDINGALEIDSTFCLAWLRKMQASISLQADSEFKKKVAREGIKHIDRLPERMQTFYKFNYWWAHEETEKAQRVLNQYKTVYPNDGMIDAARSDFYQLNGNNDDLVELEMENLRDEKEFSPSLFYYTFRHILGLGDLEKAKQVYDTYSDQLPLHQKLITGSLIDLHSRTYDSALAKLEKAQIDNPGLGQIDSLIKVVNFHKNYTNEQLDSMYQGLAGTYYIDEHYLKLKIEYNGGGNNMIWDKLNRATCYLIDHDMAYNFPLGSDYNGFMDHYIRNERGEIYRIDAYTARKIDEHFKFSQNFEDALTALKSHNYIAADSILKIEAQLENPYFFMEGYQKAIKYQLSEEKPPLMENLEGLTFRKKEDNAYAFLVIKKDDHYQFEFNFSSDDIYPTLDGELINFSSRRNLYKARDGITGIEIDRYEWSVTQNDWVLKNTYVQEVLTEIN